ASTVSQWETGQRGARGVRRHQLDALDDCYGAGGALADLADALGTPAGLPPRTTWAWNFPGPSGPVWAWIRPALGAAVRARLLWGAFRYDCAPKSDDRGVFVASPTSMPNPAVWVHLAGPGWVDFGRGVVPPQLGIPVLDPLATADLAGGGHTPAGLVSADVSARFADDPVWADAVLRFFGTRPDLVRRVFTESTIHERVLDLTRTASRQAPLPPFPAGGYRALRECRRLSCAEAAAAATALLPAEPVSDDQIGLLERGGNPRPLLLRARLDTVYRADGHTCVEVLGSTSHRSPHVVAVPRFWTGPVWFGFAAEATATADATIELGPSHKRVRVRTGVTVTCRQPPHERVPFRVHCPEGWHVTAGLGMHPEARDVNWGWRRAGDDAAGGAPVNEAFLRLFGRTAADFARLL
ncbi:MAG TPA: hypothetical protein VFI47_06420, partial [Acidimicrobiales bacterium]|nr:hypothetical protein [Acidimicrobiales bacterium]